MSKEMDALNTYIENQQKVVNRLTQTIMMLETKNKLLEAEIVKLKQEKKDIEIINTQYKESLDEFKFKRTSLNGIAIDNISKDRYKKIEQKNKFKRDSPRTIKIDMTENNNRLSRIKHKNAMIKINGADFYKQRELKESASTLTINEKNKD